RSAAASPRRFRQHTAAPRSRGSRATAVKLLEQVPSGLFLIRLIFFLFICVCLWLDFCSISQRVVTFDHDGFAALETFGDLDLVRRANADRHFRLVRQAL